MLGISTPDAIALGTLILAGLAAWQGRRSGEAARRTSLPDGAVALIGASLVDHMTLRSLVEAVQGLDATIARGLDARDAARPAGLDAVVRRLEAALDRQGPAGEVERESGRAPPPGSAVT